MDLFDDLMRSGLRVFRHGVVESIPPRPRERRFIGNTTESAESGHFRLLRQSARDGGVRVARDLQEDEREDYRAKGELSGMPRWIAVFNRIDRVVYVLERGDEIGMLEVVSDGDPELIRFTQVLCSKLLRLAETA